MEIVIAVVGLLAIVGGLLYLTKGGGGRNSSNSGGQYRILGGWSLEKCEQLIMTLYLKFEVGYRLGLMITK